LPSAQTIINNALQECGALGVGETPEAAEAQLGLSRLNRMIDLWRTRGLFVFAQSLNIYSWTAAQASRTIGPTGNFVQTFRPIAIREANYVDGNSIRTPINIRDKEWWNGQPMRSISGPYPTDLYYQPSVPDGTLFAWPVPDATVNIELATDTILSSFAALATSVDLAPGYEEAITQSLAELLCIPHSKPLTPELAESARRARAAIQGVNSKAQRISLAFGNGGGYYDYKTGRIG
jgi:hypothetical protein